jgi:hypothetical protein
MEFHDVPVNQSVPTEANRGLTSYTPTLTTPMVCATQTQPQSVVGTLIPICQSTYTTQVLSKLAQAILGKHMILYQDHNSAHCSRNVIQWMDTNGMEHSEGPSSSPDMSISETWTKPLQQRFYKHPVKTAKRGVLRFFKVCNEMDQAKINSTIDSNRHACIIVQTSQRAR